MNTKRRLDGYVRQQLKVSICMVHSCSFSQSNQGTLFLLQGIGLPHGFVGINIVRMIQFIPEWRPVAIMTGKMMCDLITWEGRGISN